MANAIDPSALSSALEVPGLRLSADGSRIHLGASGLASVTGSLANLEVSGFAPSWDLEDDHGVALFCVGAAVDPGVKAPFTDRTTGLTYYGGDRWLELPERVRNAAAPEDSTEAQAVAQVVRAAAKRVIHNRSAVKDRETDLDPDIQQYMDDGHVTASRAVAMQRTRNNKVANADLARLEAANVPTREAADGSTLYPGQVDAVAVMNRILSGEDLQEAPTYLREYPGGPAVYYAGAENGMVGPSTAGKSWKALKCCYEAWEDGDRALYLDLEDRPENVIRRVLQLGMKRAILDGQFRYVNPDMTGGSVAGLDQILEDYGPFAVIVVDGISTALGSSGVDGNNAEQYAAWRSRVLVPMVASGACLLTIDHTTKGADTKGGAEATGTMQKRALASGAVVTDHPVQTPRVGHEGWSHLFATKDKPGGVVMDPETRYVGKFTVDSRPGVSTFVDVTTVLSFRAYKEDRDADTVTSETPATMDAAIREVFPPDQVEPRLRLKGGGTKRNPALPTVGEVLYMVSVLETDDGQDGSTVTAKALFKAAKEYAPEVIGAAGETKLQGRLNTQVKGSNGKIPAMVKVGKSGYRPNPAYTPPEGRKLDQVLAVIQDATAEAEDVPDDTPDDTPEDGAVD